MECRDREVPRQRALRGRAGEVGDAGRESQRPGVLQQVQSHAQRRHEREQNQKAQSFASQPGGSQPQQKGL